MEDLDEENIRAQNNWSSQKEPFRPTLRDFFAGIALPEVVGNIHDHSANARRAYELSDAMMRERRNWV